MRTSTGAGLLPSWINMAKYNLLDIKTAVAFRQYQ